MTDGYTTTLNALAWLAGAGAALLTIAIPIAVATIAAHRAWTGPLARRRLRVRAWQLARRFRRSRPTP